MHFSMTNSLNLIVAGFVRQTNGNAHAGSTYGRKLKSSIRLLQPYKNRHLNQSSDVTDGDSTTSQRFESNAM